MNDIITGNVTEDDTSPVRLLKLAAAVQQIAGIGPGLVVVAPNGSRWRVVVSNAGVLSSALIP